MKAKKVAQGNPKQDSIYNSAHNEVTLSSQNPNLLEDFTVNALVELCNVSPSSPLDSLHDAVDTRGSISKLARFLRELQRYRGAKRRDWN
jgi:hypothetical protein